MTKEQKKERMLEVLESTVKYYSEDTRRRCINSDGNCFYSPIQAGNSLSEGCAIGRYMSNSQKTTSTLMIYDNMSINKLPKHLIPEYLTELPMSFLKNLQLLHDNGINWIVNSLSNDGKNKVNLMKSSIKAGLYEVDSLLSELEIMHQL